MGTQIAPEDLTWLLMDRPNNLMQVNGLMGFDELPEYDAVVDLIMDRMVRKYRVLSQIPVEHDGVWLWEDDVDFAIDRHVRRVVLDDGRVDAIRAYVSGQLSVPLDHSHPLWEVQLVTGPDDDPGGYVYSRFHHGTRRRHQAGAAADRQRAIRPMVPFRWRSVATPPVNITIPSSECSMSSSTR